MSIRRIGLIFTLAVLASESTLAAPEYARWTNGPPADPGFFPIAVWLQSPANAEKYRAAGINTYVGLWRGPTEEQLAALKRAGMKVICGQNEVGLRHRRDTGIIGWMHGDEPDNAQSLGAGKGYGPPVPPRKIISAYERMRTEDPSRPVLLNLGQGVAWDNYIGRGVRRNHPEDYPEYLKGCDIASFDIYPVVHESPEIAGKLWFVAHGVERLGRWSAGQKIVWNCIECTRIGNPERKATPRQVRAEVWMSLIHGSRGLIYFVHQFKPVFREAALLDDPEMLAAVTALNRQITGLAPVLNSPTLDEGLAVISGNPEMPIATMLKRHKSTNYLFAVPMREGNTDATFALKGLTGAEAVEVMGEERIIPVTGESFRDRFTGWDARIYRIGSVRDGQRDRP
jgi:hypothetical protein